MLITGFVALTLLAVPVLVTSPAFAAIDIGNCVGQGTEGEGDLSNAANGCTYDPGTTDTNLTDIIATVVNIISIIVGVIAVIMIIWGGMKYITSGGESGKITSAKNTIIYALIGLVIVALAQFIVRFVLQKAADVAQ